MIRSHKRDNPDADKTPGIYDWAKRIGDDDQPQAKLTPAQEAAFRAMSKKHF